VDTPISLKKVKNNVKVQQEEEWEKVLRIFKLNRQAKQLPKLKRPSKGSKSINKRTIDQSKVISNENDITLPSIFRRPMKECIKLYDKNDVSSEKELVSEKKLWENYFTKEEIESVYNANNPEHRSEGTSEESEEVSSLKFPEPILTPTIKKTLKPPLRINIGVNAGIAQSTARQRETSARKYIQMRNLLYKKQLTTKSNKSVSCKLTFRNNVTNIDKTRKSVATKKEDISPSMSLLQNEDKHVITINIRSFNFNAYNVEARSDKKSIGNEIYTNANVKTFMSDNEVYNKIIKSSNYKYKRKNVYNDKRNAIESIMMNMKDVSSMEDKMYHTSRLNSNNN
jgi:hypothetical protein